MPRQRDGTRSGRAGGCPMVTRWSAVRAVRRPGRHGGIAAAAVGCAALLAGLGAAAPAAGSVGRAHAASAIRGARLWVSRYNGASRGRYADVAVSPDGSKVFVAGTSPSGATSTDYATVAY